MLVLYIYTIIKTTSVCDKSSVGDGLALHGNQTWIGNCKLVTTSVASTAGVLVILKFHYQP